MTEIATRSEGQNTKKDLRSVSPLSPQENPESVTFFSPLADAATNALRQSLQLSMNATREDSLAAMRQQLTFGQLNTIVDARIRDVKNTKATYEEIHPDSIKYRAATSFAYPVVTDSRDAKTTVSVIPKAKGILRRRNGNYWKVVEGERSNALTSLEFSRETIEDDVKKANPFNPELPLLEQIKVITKDLDRGKKLKAGTQDAKNLNKFIALERERWEKKAIDLPDGEEKTNAELTILLFQTYHPKVAELLQR